MISACANLAVHGVIEGVLGGVDCETRSLAAAGYGALTSSSSVFQHALTALLTIYVAVTGYRMLFAHRGARLSSASGMALKIGAVLALVTSWPTFQTLIFNVAADAPGELAAAIAEPFQRDAGLGGDPVQALQGVYDQVTAMEAAFGTAAGNAKTYASPSASAAESLSTASGVLFLSTAGVLAATTIVVGVLTAAGPIFISFFLMPVTRGLFVGWLRALVAAALITLVTWLLIVTELHLLQPWLDELQAQLRASALDPETAKSVTAFILVFGGGEVALVIGALVVALGFRLPTSVKGGKASEDAAPAAVSVAPVTLPSGAQRLVMNLQRDQAVEAARRPSLHVKHLQAGRRTVVAADATGSREEAASDLRRPRVIGRRVGAEA